jgi:hypothetical protein
MTSRAAWLLCGFGVIGAYVVLALCSPTLSGPPEIRITPPAPALGAKLAALSGVWEPTQDAILASRVVVEQIDESRATLLLIGRNHPPGYPNGWERVRARVLGDGQIQWGYPTRFTLRLAESGATLETRIERAGATASMTYKKAGAFVNLPGSSTVQAAITKIEQQPGREAEH